MIESAMIEVLGVAGTSRQLVLGFLQGVLPLDGAGTHFRLGVGVLETAVEQFLSRRRLGLVEVHLRIYANRLFSV
jgi:hypothetical protein